jgi:hypothetical protein
LTAEALLVPTGVVARGEMCNRTQIASIVLTER